MHLRRANNSQNVADQQWLFTSPESTTTQQYSPVNKGSIAEDQALEYLLEKGLRLVDRNYRCRRGEIDLIMRQAVTLVFVEVRFRKSARYGSALESVDTRKQSRIIHCALQYITNNHISTATRFDVVAISPKNGNLEIEWIPDAFHT